jgi:hypothetical protein
MSSTFVIAPELGTASPPTKRAFGEQLICMPACFHHDSNDVFYMDSPDGWLTLSFQRIIGNAGRRCVFPRVYRGQCR